VEGLGIMQKLCGPALRKAILKIFLVTILLASSALVHAAQETSAAQEMHAAQKARDAAIVQERHAAQKVREAQAISPARARQATRVMQETHIEREDKFCSAILANYPGLYEEWDPDFVYDLAEIERLLKAGVDPNMRVVAHNTALCEALTDNRPSSGELTQLLIRYGADFRVMGVTENEILACALCADQDFETKKMKIEALMAAGFRFDAYKALGLLSGKQKEVYYWQPPRIYKENYYGKLSAENKRLMLLMRDHGIKGWTELYSVLPAADPVSIIVEYAQLPAYTWLTFLTAPGISQQMPPAASEEKDDQGPEDEGREPALKKRKREQDSGHAENNGYAQEPAAGEAHEIMADEAYYDLS